ncbi:UPF0280 family protein [Candidatus Aerophobetes bacterium]|nr:UPF0280 family protein [Candidatus Aerophobetes bacterium]
MKKELVYRELITPRDLFSFQVEIKESNLFVLASRKLPKQTEEALVWCRKDIEQYIYRNPIFRTTFKPFPLEEGMPPIVRTMAEAGREAGVGPMAAVAGAIAEFVGKELLNYCDQVIVENGGDIFMKVKRRRIVGIYAGDSPLSKRIALQIEPQDTPLGICCSAGTFGRSQSLGTADAVIILSPFTALADAVATAVGNLVKDEAGIQKGLEFVRKIPFIRGGVIVKEKKMGAWGRLRILRGVH